MSASTLPVLVRAIVSSRDACLLLGAGISIAAGIPGGDGLPIAFAAQHREQLPRWRLDAAFARAERDGTWEAQSAFAAALLDAFLRNPALQEALLAWLMTCPGMAGGAFTPHALFALAWVQRLFRHLVTTNWDFLLESQLDALYDRALSDDPFQPVEYQVEDGTSYRVPAGDLFYPEPLGEGAAAWNPRWEIVANDADLTRVRRWSRPLWKVHGSPFFLACPRCSGITRWKRLEPLRVGDSCPLHPEVCLAPDIAFWGQGLDRAYSEVWHTLRARLRRCDLVVVCGFSGSGTDVYLRAPLEEQ